MKKQFLFVLSLALVFCGSLWSCSDNGPAMPTDDPKTSLLNEFLNSEYGIATLENHGLTKANLDLKNSTSDFFKSKRATSFAIPIIENGRITGKLNAFIVSGDDSYRAIVEKWENPSDKEYSVTITTGYGMYLATVGIVHDGKRKTQKIMDIASYNDAEKIQNIEVQTSQKKVGGRVQQGYIKLQNKLVMAIVNVISYVILLTLQVVVLFLWQLPQQ